MVMRGVTWARGVHFDVGVSGSVTQGTNAPIHSIRLPSPSSSGHCPCIDATRAAESLLILGSCWIDLYFSCFFFWILVSFWICLWDYLLAGN